MLKALLVEDEDLIRNGLASGVPWAELGIELLDVAEDGEIALQIARDSLPDIVITDIQMPFMTGLEFMAAYKKENPGAVFIVISGHDEFEYAQQAIRLGAYDYILKPVNLAYLGMLLRDIKDEAAARSQSTNQQANLASIQKKQLLRDLIFKKVPIRFLEYDFAGLGIETGSYFAVVAIQLDDYYRLIQDKSDDEAEEIARIFHDSIQAAVSGRSSALETSGSMLTSILCLSAATEEAARNESRHLVDEVVTAIQRASFSVSVGIGSVQKGLGLIAKSYEQSLEALNGKFLTGSGAVHPFKTPEPVRNEVSRDRRDLVQEIKECIELLDIEGFEKEIPRLIDILGSDSESAYSAIRFHGSEIYIEALQVLQKQGRTIEEVFEDPAATYQNIFKQESLKDIVATLTETIGRILLYLVERSQSRQDSAIFRARKKIEEEFTNSSLSLDDVAGYANMSPCYFTVVFKKETKKSFVEFLTEVRLNRAKNLLAKTQMKTYEISYSVGYENPTYFSSVFKKYNDESPSEYRKRMKGSE